ncbi:N-acetylglucosamine-6-phosphate deacetylase [Thioclava dalianensis]|uniref:N-acetylglucosamine-6-phosphate deacetylase n=1 Tax=Thioclava dalianensis TaxID=1185766 RepID=A0A074TIX4_9RHOB|nr:N-acetylglucosamine-6-phosphate deacetylase [Thioclava dalianensis]KEP70110.1 N-acetylglucosamine-6-phosphate deacetylase [Thioclava dalianensis]SFN50909.1 N-acetylglucosamine-6-phosphate deacetylase [Thioclava dalianensis]
MSPLTIYTGARIFDGATLFEDHALVIEAGCVREITPESALSDTALPEEAKRIALQGGVLAPGLLDLQVNGGGGVMLGAGDPAHEIATICAAHRGLGTAGVLPTLITARRETVGAVLAAGAQAARDGVAGFIGVHLEGPHLDLARKGAHAPELIRPMEQDDLEMICRAAKTMPALMVTLAPEAATPEQIAALARAGVIVSLGHSDCSYERARVAFAAGARCVTHLFNAMSPLGHREPGLVGAALDSEVCAGIIADLVHVSQPALGIAARSKRSPGLFLVTDAMAVAGTDLDGFTLNDRWIERRDGRLTLADGTLAGADVSLPEALGVMHHRVGCDLAEVLGMATRVPAELLGLGATFGHLRPGAEAVDLVHLGDDLSLIALGSEVGRSS